MLLIRNATRADIQVITTMIRELAEFEHELEYFTVTPEDLLRDGFGDKEQFRALIAEWDGQTAAYAVCFFAYSTLAGRPSLFIEDLFVRPPFRRKGIGRALLQRMALIAREQNCWGMRWEVLNWNTAAIKFYWSLGATVQSESVPVFFFGDGFQEFARQNSHPIKPDC